MEEELSATLSLAWFYCNYRKQHVMRAIIQDEASHQFIEGPTQPKADFYNAMDSNTGRTYNTTPVEPVVQGDENDIDIARYEAYERYD